MDTSICRERVNVPAAGCGSVAVHTSRVRSSTICHAPVPRKTGWALARGALSRRCADRHIRCLGHLPSPHTRIPCTAVGENALPFAWRGTHPSLCNAFLSSSVVNLPLALRPLDLQGGWFTRRDTQIPPHCTSLSEVRSWTLWHAPSSRHLQRNGVSTSSRWKTRVRSCCLLSLHYSPAAPRP